MRQRLSVLIFIAALGITGSSMAQNPVVGGSQTPVLGGVTLPQQMFRPNPPVGQTQQQPNSPGVYNGSNAPRGTYGSQTQKYPSNQSNSSTSGAGSQCRHHTTCMKLTANGSCAEWYDLGCY
jgi:hypothetical protein